MCYWSNKGGTKRVKLELCHNREVISSTERDVRKEGTTLFFLSCVFQFKDFDILCCAISISEHLLMSIMLMHQHIMHTVGQDKLC